MTCLFSGWHASCLTMQNTPLLMVDWLLVVGGKGRKY